MKANIIGYYKTTEVCSECDHENDVVFSEDEHDIKCEHCGEVMLLCSACTGDGCKKCFKKVGSGFVRHPEQVIHY